MLPRPAVVARIDTLIFPGLRVEVYMHEIRPRRTPGFISAIKQCLLQRIR